MTKNRLLFGLILILFISSYSAEGIVHLPPKAIKTPNDLTYIVDSTGNDLTWQYEAEESGDIPGTYTVTVDAVPVVGHTDADWEDKVDIIVNVDGLALGEHTVKMSITDHDTADEAAITAQDTVMVTVNPNTGTTISSNTSPTSSVPSSSDDAVFPFVAMIIAIVIGIPILKIKDFRH
ncbi:MAG: hypothetical protein ACW99A_06780 [Candidatus Kariarchaeaceae archaeon]